MYEWVIFGLGSGSLWKIYQTLGGSTIQLRIELCTKYSVEWLAVLGRSHESGLTTSHTLFREMFSGVWQLLSSSDDTENSDDVDLSSATEPSF